MKTRISIEEFNAKISGVPIIDFARLAAFIDGEGSILISRALPIAKHRQKSITYSLAVVITNTSPQLIAWLYDNFGGSVHNKKPSEGSKSFRSKRPIWSWHLQEKQAEVVLRKCLRYFIIKQQQAEIGIAFCALKKRSGPRFVRVSKQSLRQRENLHNKIHLLNSPHLVKRVG
jgi:hypothetical protein